MNNLVEKHELRRVLPGMHYDGVAVADFAPTADEPDLQIWPHPSDRGARSFSGDASDLIPVFNSHPEPNVRWLTAKQFQIEFGYPENAVESTVRPTAFEEFQVQDRLRLTEPRMEALERLAQLWNGNVVGPNEVHLLRDKVPSWNEIVPDLEQEHLRDFFPTVTEHEQEVIDAFGEYDWFSASTVNRAWLKEDYIVGVHSVYDLEERARTLINGREDLPSLAGDPHEGLAHRFGVGLEAARAKFVENRHDIRSYATLQGYTVDLLEIDSRGNRWIGEVLTDHNNNQLYRSTLEKLIDIGEPSVLIFDTRSTLKRVLNHIEQSGLGVDVPGAPFNSAPRMDWLREKTMQRARDSSYAWPVEDLFTLSSLWDTVFEGKAPTRRQILSIDW